MIVPYISREDVSEALASLIYSHNLETNGLRYLLLVDLLVTAPEMPSGDGVRDFAIRELLEREIVRALSEQRAVLQLALPNQKAPLELVRHEIAEAVAQNTHQLIVWSLLYYRYVRAELGFSVEMLAKLLSIHLRTISRYSDEGIQLLTERLMLLERQVRQEQKQRRLIAALPYSVPIRLTGRMHQMRSVHEMLAAFSPRHIFITGASGIGKTMFVQEVLRQQIAEGNLEQLVWIDQPESVEYARQRITEALLREDGTLDLREYLLLHSTAIVCDGIEALATEQSAFEQLLRDLGMATVILVNLSYLPLSSLEAHLALPELDFDAASEMLDDFISGNDGTYNDGVIHSLYQRFGGNPLALRLGLGLWQSTENWSVVQEELGERLLGQLFLTLSDEGKGAWCLCALFSQGISSSDLASNSSISSRTLRTLQDYGLIQRDRELYKLVPIARDFIWQEYARNAEVKLTVDRLFAWIETQDRGFEVIEQALVTGFPEMSTIQRRRWIREGWKEGIRRNHWVIWRTIIEEYIHEDSNFDAALLTAYGICLRRLGYWAEAARVFENIIVEAGRKGEFEAQARAFFEFSLLIKYRGDYERAYSSLKQAKRFAQRSRDADLSTQIAQQEAEFLIQQGKGAEAFERLVPLPQNADVLALESEAQFVIGNQEQCRELALGALKLIKHNQAMEASLYTILGRSFERQGDREQAQRYITNAVMLLERLGDLFSLARAQANLAALLIPLQRYADAGRLLAESERIQSRLGDHVGLSASRHNRRLLTRYIAR